MIKTSINRHDLEYFVYAMTRAFYKEATVLAPDTAEHNKAEDTARPDEDVISFVIDRDTFNVVISKGQWLHKDANYNYSISSNVTDGDRYKDEIRGYIYDTFREYTERELPWGNLTGIRPTKLYLHRLKELAGSGKPIDDKDNINLVTEYMKKTYRVSDSKNRLGADIAIREEIIINSVHLNDGYSIYIGIPFCPSTCLYCSFTSNPIFSYKDRIDAYIQAVIKELEMTSKMMKGKVLDTVYIGGGTPTTLEAEELEKLLSAIKAILPMEQVKEFTVEAGRADSITIEKLQVLKAYNVSRISINPQSMRDKTLKLIGRHHRAEDVVNAFNMARSMGFDNINMDIILGLPGEDIEDVTYTLNEIEKLDPESLTVHSLAIKRASRLKEYMESNDISTNMNLDDAMNLAFDYASRKGLDPYYLYRQKDMAGNLENTGFARKGLYGIYNILMMEEVQSIVACGAGTVTKRVWPLGDGVSSSNARIERCDTVKDVSLYISNIDEMIERKRDLFSKT